MAQTFTRQELFDLVWSEPTRTVAKRLGISDVGLAKACRKADLVMPPRGYWAKLAAGKPVKKPSLPPRGPGMSNHITLGRDRWSWGPDAVTLDTPIPPVPVFSESLEALGERIRRMIGTVSRTRNLEGAHARILSLLAEDEKRRDRQRQSSYPTWDPPLFEAPFEQRRLRLLNSFMRALDKVGVSVVIEGKDARQLVAYVGDFGVSFTIDKAGSSSRQKGSKRAASPMRCEVMSLRGGTDAIASWSDTAEAPLERSLADIAVAIVVHGERICRSSEEHHREWIINRKEELAEELRKKEEERRRLERERIAHLEKARVDRLLDQAHALRLADEIRSYAAAVSERHRLLENPLSPEELQNWTKWALDRADQIDPLKNGMFRTVQQDAAEQLGS